MSKKVLVTGIGLITPGASDIESLWSRVKSGDSYLERINELEEMISVCLGNRFDGSYAIGSRFDRNLTLQDYLDGDFGHEKLYDLTTKLSLISSQRAVEDAGFGNFPKNSFVFYGSARGNTSEFEKKLQQIYSSIEHREKLKKVMRHVRGASITSESSIASSVSRYHGLKGFTTTIGSACTSSLSSLKIAADYIRMGETDIAIAGGSEAALNLPMYLWFRLGGMYCSSVEEIKNAVRPFCNTRNGTAISEGSCSLILESEEHALQRGAKIYGEISSVLTSIDPNTINFESMSGDGLEYGSLIKKSIELSGLSTEEIDLISAHAPGTRGDAIEVRAIDRVFKMHPPTVSFKGITGHSIGACGLLEVALSLKAMQDSYVPANHNVHEVEIVSDVQNIPTTGFSKNINSILKTGSGFGGYIASTVLKNYVF